MSRIEGVEGAPVSCLVRMDLYGVYGVYVGRIGECRNVVILECWRIGECELVIWVMLGPGDGGEWRVREIVIK